MFGLSKFYIYGIISLVVIATVGGFFFHQRSIVSSLETTIKEKDQEIVLLQEQVSGLIIDKEKLTQSNLSLETEIDRRVQEVQKVYDDLAKLQKLDQVSQTRIVQLERKINDQERIEQLDRIRASRKASLLLRIINNNVECEIENWDRVGLGKCVNGQFRPAEGN